MNRDRLMLRFVKSFEAFERKLPASATEGPEYETMMESWIPLASNHPTFWLCVSGDDDADTRP